MRNIILASSSPRRIELLSRLIKDFTVIASGADETVDASLSPRDVVVALALRKARWVFDEHPDSIVIGADTLVVHQGEMLGKPKSEQEAKAMLLRLQGCGHDVFTGLAVMAPERTETQVVCTRVQFAPMDADEIDAYVATGEPMDKAGAYGIQGVGGAYICEIHGNYENVMGLPLCAMRLMLQGLGVIPAQMA